MEATGSLALGCSLGPASEAGVGTTMIFLVGLEAVGFVLVGLGAAAFFTHCVLLEL